MPNLAGLFPSRSDFGQAWNFFAFALEDTAAFVAIFRLCFAQRIRRWFRGILPRGQPRPERPFWAYIGINHNGPARANAPKLSAKNYRKTTWLFYKSIIKESSTLFQFRLAFWKNGLSKKDRYFFGNRLAIEANHAHEESSIKNAYFSIKDWLLTNSTLN